MPRRDDLHRILIIGAGPTVAGRTCELDSAGSQACKALLEEGCEVVIVNSDPATIMTDPELATRTYIEPLDLVTLTRIIESERPDALLPTLGGQTALDLAVQLKDAGVLDLWEVELIGVDEQAIRRAGDRLELLTAVEEIGLRVPRSLPAEAMEEAERVRQELGLPLVVRPVRAVGGGIARDDESLAHHVQQGLRLSPVTRVILEESVAGRQELELEVMRDHADNVVVICSSENIDPVGIHSGDSVTVAPALTLTGPQYQELRDAARAIVRKIGVAAGSASVRFAVDPETGEVAVIGVHPRLSRSSALASKATGFPIARVAARLAVGYTLDEVAKDITRRGAACLEPALDHVVVKMPRWAFEKFPLADHELTTHSQSVGETMAIGRTFKEAFLKALRSRELDVSAEMPASAPESRKALAVPTAERYELVLQAYRQGFGVDELHELTGISPFFLSELGDIVELEREVRTAPGISPELLLRMKRYGLSDRRLAELSGRTEREVRALRIEHGVLPVYKAVGTCAAESAAEAPCFYSCYEEENEAVPGDRPRVVILGSGPNRIGEGVGFDYCCVHAALTAREMGFGTVMVNCNPQAVSTDSHVSDRLYFEPLTFEDVANVVANERPMGVIVQFGGQTSLKIAGALAEAGSVILGTAHEAVDLAEDRERLGPLLDELGIRCPEHGLATSVEEAGVIAGRVGYPLLVRPSQGLGGRALQIVYGATELEHYMATTARLSPHDAVLIDSFLEDAIEVDVDAVADGHDVYIGAVMQHIDEAGVHAGDSARVIPSISLGEGALEQVRTQTRQLALALGVRGLINVQFALRDNRLYALEVNPRGSRTVPFVSKATGVPLVRLATRVILGEKLSDLSPRALVPEHVSVRAAVLPGPRFPGTDTRFGLVMKSSGEVMGVADDFPAAFAKAVAAAGAPLPTEGGVFLSVGDGDKSAATILAQRLHSLGFTIYATRGTAMALSSLGIPVRVVNKIVRGEPSVVDLIESGEIVLVVNAPVGRGARSDGYEIRTTALRKGVPSITTLAGASAAVSAIEAAQHPRLQVHCLQDLHAAAEGS